MKVPMNGGAAETLCGADNPWGVSWGADDMILFGQGPEGIWRVPSGGGTPEVVITVKEGEQAHGPQALPRGDWVLFTLRPAGVPSWDEALIVMESLATGERVQLLEGGRDARYVETGHLVYGLNKGVFAVAFDIEAGTVTGPPVSLIEGVRDTTRTGAVQFSVARNGSLVYVPDGLGERNVSSLVWIDRRTGEETPTAAPIRNYRDVSISPDGNHVATDIFDQETRDVWTWQVGGSLLRPLTFDGESSIPLWSPDGLQIVFTSTNDGAGSHLVRRAADRSSGPEDLPSPTDISASSWVDEGLLLFNRQGDIGVFAVDGERTTQMLMENEFSESRPALSPNGRWLAYQANESGQTEIYVVPFPNVANGGKWLVSTNGGSAPVWAPDGRSLFFVSGRAPGLRRSPTAQMMVAEVETRQTFDHEAPVQLFRLSGYEGGWGRPFDLSPDGERFLVVKPEETLPGDYAFAGLIFVENWFEELKERVPVP